MPEGTSNVSCIWKSDTYSSWCEFNFTYGGWEDREVKNFWLALNSTTEDWQAAADYEGFSGNQGNNIAQGCYYILVKLGDPPINVSINSTVVASFNGSGTVNTYATATCYNFTNGTWVVGIEDLWGPDDFNWYITVGNASPPESGLGNDSLLEGFVAGSPAYANVSVELYKLPNASIPINFTKTDSSGHFSFNLAPGVYTAEFRLEPDCVFNGTGPCEEEGLAIRISNITVGNVTVSINVSVPHIAFALMLDGSNIPQGTQIMATQNTSYIFGLYAENKDGFAAGMISMVFNATDDIGHWGSQAVFFNSTPSLNPGQNVTLTVPFTTSFGTGIRNASMKTDIGITQASDVISGDVASAVLEVLFNMPLQFNITI